MDSSLISIMNAVWLKTATMSVEAGPSSQALDDFKQAANDISKQSASLNELVEAALTR